MASSVYQELLDALEDEYGVYMHINEFERIMSQFGLMIVPIEDPTNLMGEIDEG